MSKTTKAQRDKIKEAIKDWPKDRAKVFNDLLADVEQAEQYCKTLVDLIEGFNPENQVREAIDKIQEYFNYV